MRNPLNPLISLTVRVPRSFRQKLIDKYGSISKGILALLKKEFRE